jgi:homoprotocatechuate degradation regulator HpaR
MTPGRRNLPLLLLHAREAAMAHFRPILRRFGLTDQQWRVVRALGEVQALEPGQIADACRILGPSLTGILARLEQTGLVRRQWSPLDQRRQLVSLTAKGRALVDRMTPLIDRQYALIEGELGADRLKALYDMLDDAVMRLRRTAPAAAEAARAAAASER